MRNDIARKLLVLLLLLTSACASAPVRTGTLVGAGAGALLGAGTGVLISSEDLLGSSKSEASGDLALPPAQTIGASALIGVVFGAIVGALLGHGQEQPFAAPATASSHAQRTAPPAF